MGSFLVPEIDMIFGDGVGASLVRRPYCEHGVGLWCDVDALGLGGLKTRPPRRHLIQSVESPVLRGPRV